MKWKGKRMHRWEPSPLWDFHRFLEHSATKLRKDLGSPADSSSIIKIKKKRGKLCFFFSCYLPWGESTKETIFQLVFWLSLTNVYILGDIWKKLAEVFLLHLFMVLKCFGCLIMNRVPGGQQLDNISENVTSTSWFVVEGQHRLMCECKGTVRQ